MRRSGGLRGRGGRRGSGRSGGPRGRGGRGHRLWRHDDAGGPKDLVSMMFGVYLVEGVADAPVLAHEERLAERTDSPGGVRILAPGPVRLVDGVVGIRQELERQVVLDGEGVVRRRVVARDPENLDAGLLQLGPAIAQAARLPCTTGRVIFRVKIDQDVLAAPKVTQRDRLTRASRKRKIRGGRTGTQGRGRLRFIGHLAVLRWRRISK